MGGDGRGWEQPEEEVRGTINDGGTDGEGGCTRGRGG